MSGELVNTNLRFCPAGVEVRVRAKGDSTQVTPIQLPAMQVGRPDLTESILSDYDNYEAFLTRNID